jgi:hypothetical protein
MVRERADTADQSLMAQPVDNYRDVKAWVLIGDPGAGKSDVFRALSQAEGGTYCPARDFTAIGPGTQWSEPLFIDGLDEISAGTLSGTTALDRIRTKLQELGTPRFRISCREADWRGAADSAALQRLVGSEDFKELRLEPLSREEARSLVAHWRSTDTEQAAQFLRMAEERGLDGLLDNPQNLRMLVKATASGWPASRLQTYEKACSELVREENPEHRAANHVSPRPHVELLRASEYVCAVLLLSGKNSLAEQQADAVPSDSFPLLDLPTQPPDTPESESCRDVLHTRLFRGAAGLFFPVHRTVAEYLGARYLRDRIATGLPAGRVLALMLGEDGVPVPELRGLHAWLAAMDTGDLRAELIKQDPLGVVLYGDVRSFKRKDKMRVLEALSAEARRYTFFRSQDWSSKPFGALATDDMEEDFRALLSSPERSPAHLVLVDCVLDALAHGQAMPGLKPELEKVIRDAGYWSDSRRMALRVLLVLEEKANNWQASLALLQDVSVGTVEDAQDELLGSLLTKLYPAQISAAQLWQYFKQPKSDTFFGAYRSFWYHLADKYASTEDIPMLLDALIAQGYQLDNRPDRLGSAGVIGKLLHSALKAYGSVIDVPRLYRWLALGLGPHSYCPLGHEHQSNISAWLNEHPELYKALFEYGVKQQLDKEDARAAYWQVQKHLYQAREPSDAERWYLSLADATIQDEWRRILLEKAFHSAKNLSGDNSAIELLESWRAMHPCDAQWIDRFLQSPYPPSASAQEHILFEIEHQRSVDEESRQKIEFFRDTLPSFKTEMPHLNALVAVGNAYLASTWDAEGDTPRERLLNLLNQNDDWVEQALNGLRQCLRRNDLPSAQDILDLHAKQRCYNLAAPCLAAMALRQDEDPVTALALPDNVLETVVAFRLTNDYGSDPEWFKELLKARPKTVASVALPFIKVEVAKKRGYVPVLHNIAHDPDYVALASLIVPELIRGFPAPAHKKQLDTLCQLIVTALLRLDEDTVLTLVAKKLSSQTLDVAQHVYWLGAGLQLAPSVYLEQTRQYVGKSQLRGTHLADLLRALREKRNDARPDWPVAVLDYLIQLLGPRTSPRVWGSGAHWVSPAMELSEFVQGLIMTLAGLPDDDATHALTSLLTDTRLTGWENTLRRAAFDQQVIRRKANFQPASVSRVFNTLANLNPANAADLWALTQDHLQQLIRRIRDDSTNDYKQYWADSKPKLENDCRDALLSDLKLRLEPLAITAEREVSYVDDKRADIKVSAEGYSIPIEVKCEWRPELWSAVEAQLIAKYTRDPACDGFGIYLVIWFGGTRQTSTPLDGGARPKSPAELRERLTTMIPEVHQHKIVVLVLDCSLPKATPT